MLIIGITGGIGSGKSHICNLLSDLNYPIYSSDKKAKEIISTNKEVKKDIIKLLGKDAYIKGQYNVRYVSRKVFYSKRLLDELNRIIHPIVNNFFCSFVDEQKLAKSEIVFKESALIVETEDYKSLDFTILVSSPLNIRSQRVLQRKDMSLEKFDSIVERQLSDEIRKEFCDYTIRNDNNNAFLSDLLKYLNLIKTMK